MDDRADLDELVVVEVDAVRQSPGKHAAEGELVDEIFERSHLLDHRDLLEEVVQREFAGQHPRGVFLRLLLVDDFLEVLHQANDVAHTEDATRHAVGTELLELVHRFADAAEEDRCAGDLFDAECGAATGITIELRQDHASDVELVVEVVGGGNGVLADHRVDHQVDVLSRHGGLDRAQFGHQFFVDREAAGGVVDDDVAAGLLGFGFGGLADVDRVGALDVEYRNADLFAENAQLLDGGRALHVRRNHQRLLAIVLEPACELGAGGRLARALKPAHDDLGRTALGPKNRFLVVVHQRDELVVARLDELLPGADGVRLTVLFHPGLDRVADRLFLHACEEGLGDPEFDVGFQQTESDFAESGIDVLGGELRQPGEAIARLAKPFGDRIEHGSSAANSTDVSCLRRDGAVRSLPRGRRPALCRRRRCRPLPAGWW